MGKRRRTRIRVVVGASVAAVLAVVVGITVALALAAPKADTAEAAAWNSAHATLPAQKFTPGVLFIGDSFTGGSKMGGNDDKGWPALVKADLSKAGTPIESALLVRGGSGYVTIGPSGQNFGQALTDGHYLNVDVVVVFGSINDTNQTAAPVGDAARKLYAEIKKQSPNAKLIVVGPSWMNDVPVPQMYPMRDQLKAAAADAGATWVDPLADKWFTGAAASMIGTDKTHPNDAGHRYMADFLSPVIGAVVKQTYAEHKS